MRPTVFRHHDQLCRPAGAGRARAVFAVHHRMERDSVWLHRELVPGGLRRGPAGGRRCDRPFGNKDRLRDLDRHMEPGGDEPCAGAYRAGIRGGALRAGSGRGGKFSGGDQNRGGVVSAQGARAGNRHLQFRIERGGHRRAAGGAVDYGAARVALGVPVYWFPERGLADLMADDLPSGAGADSRR